MLLNFELRFFKNKNSADLRTFVVKMSRVEFTHFFKTKTLILLVFLLVFNSYFCLKSARILLVFSKNWARMKNLPHWSRLADPNHGTAIKSFKKAEDQKSKLPHKLRGKKRVETLVMLSSIDYRVLQPLESNVARSCSVISLPHINHLLAMST